MNLSAKPMTEREALSNLLIAADAALDFLHHLGYCGGGAAFDARLQRAAWHAERILGIAPERENWTFPRLRPDVGEQNPGGPLVNVDATPTPFHWRRGGPATDIRLAWPGCSKWEPEAEG